MQKPVNIFFLSHNKTEGGTGHPGFISHKQPAIEKHLRNRILGLGIASIRLGARIIDIKEDSGSATATYLDTSNQERIIKCKFFVGADGKTGFTRKQYLEARGIKMENSSKAPYQETWVALNWRISIPTPKSHPCFPLWKLGYTPEEVYDAFFPPGFRFLCNSFRAAVCGRFGLDSDRLWRFEFVVRPDEKPAEMATPASMAKIVHPYITHPGSRYGLSDEEIVYPLDCIQVLRCRPFLFSARSCNKWALGRVILCGDAAHVFPPFGGQGIASGFRDAISLAWRLAIATGPLFTGSHCALLDGWYLERKQQLDKSLQSTIENGNYVTESNPFKVFLRDWYLWFIQQVPSWRHWLELGSRRDGMVQYEGQGLPFSASGGRNFPQVYVSPISNLCKVLFTDDVIFSPEKKGLFQIAVLLHSLEEADSVYEALNGLGEVSQGALSENEATLFLDTTENLVVSTKDHRIYRLATATEFASNGQCAGRPDPIGYDAHRMSKEVGYNRFIILRPDRFIFAACNTQYELYSATKSLGTLFVNGAM